MSLPKEGSRDVHDGIIVSVVPDICLTPAGGGMVPIPYTIWCLQADAANLANSVRQTSNRSHAVASIVLHCFGDEPGTGGGIFSGTTGAECTPKTWSQTIRVEGRNLVRHTDEWWMNHRNTFGRLIYVKDMMIYGTPDIASVKPQMSNFFTNFVQNTVMVRQASQMPQASIPSPVETPMGPLPGPAQVQQLGNVGTALQQGYDEQFGPGTMPLWQRPAANIQRLRDYFLNKSHDESSAQEDSDEARVTRKYPNQTCDDDRLNQLEGEKNRICRSIFTNNAFHTMNAKKLAKVSCADILQRWSDQKACLRARNQVQEECFKDNPQSGHEEQIQGLQNGINNMEALNAANNCPPLPEGIA